MQQFRAEIRRTLIVLVVISLIFCFTAYGLGHKLAIPGFAIGVLAGIGTGALLYKQIAKIAGMPEEQVIAYSRSSWWIRFSIVMAVLAVTYYTSMVSFAAALVGWLSTQIALIVSAMIAVRKWF